jgi:hypothetical protein
MPMDRGSAWLARSRDYDAKAPDSLGDLARRTGMQAGVVGDRADRCGARANGDEYDNGRARARVAARRPGHAEGRFGTRGPVPLHAVANEHDPEPLTDPEMNRLPAVRLGHGDFAVRRRGARRRSAAHCHTGPVSLGPSVSRGAAASERRQRRQRRDGDLNPDGSHTTITHTTITHTTMTCRASDRFRTTAPFDMLVIRVWSQGHCGLLEGGHSPGRALRMGSGAGTSSRRIPDQM